MQQITIKPYKKFSENVLLGVNVRNLICFNFFFGKIEDDNIFIQLILFLISLSIEVILERSMHGLIFRS